MDVLDHQMPVRKIFICDTYFGLYNRCFCNVEIPDEDEVRAPIPQKQETLVGPGYEAYPITRPNMKKTRVKTVFDGFRNFGSEASK